MNLNTVTVVLQKAWKWTELDDGIKFSLDSPDGDQGYPGQLKVTSAYQINDKDELTMKFVARVDNIPTIINMTNHAFINLAGQVGKLFIFFFFFWRNLYIHDMHTSCICKYFIFLCFDNLVVLLLVN